MNIKPEIIRAAADISNALARFQTVAQQADAEAETTPPGSLEERYALNIGRVVKHLEQALADMPASIWLAMCKKSALQINKITSARAA